MEVKSARFCNNNTNSNSTTTIQSGSTGSSDHEDQEDVITDLRRGPWTVEEDFKLINYIANHGEGRWNSLARCAGLKRTGKSCRLRWLNYLRPDVRRGNITLEEQLLILELHSRWGNRWSKIAQHLPGRTDNEIKNYWRTRVQKHAKQLKCDVNSKQFKDTMRYLWMPRLIERIQASNPTGTTGGASSSTMTATTTTTTTTTTNNDMTMPYIAQQIMTTTTPSTYTQENSSTAASSDSFGTQVSPVSDLTADYYTIPVNNNTNQDYFQTGFSESLISPSDFYNPGPIDFQAMETNNDHQLQDGGDASANLWNMDDVWFLQQFNNM